MTEPSDKVTACARCSKAKLPLTVKKPNKSMSKLPAALRISPSLPSMFRAKLVLVPVGMLKLVLPLA